MRILIFLFLSISIFISCSEDNDSYNNPDQGENFGNEEINEGLTYRIKGSDLSETEGVAYQKGGNFHIGSLDVDVDCSGDGIAASFDGGNFFSFLFYGDEFGTQVISGNFETEIDGKMVSLTSRAIPQPCQGDALEVAYQINDDRISGTFTGEFFTFSDSLVLPFDSCVNYISVGVLEASFNVPIIPCE